MSSRGGDNSRRAAVAKFRKIVVEPGTHHHRGGVEVIPPARINRWVDIFQQMKRAGIRIPCPWGHQAKANPIEEDRLAENEFYKSRFNATYVDDLEIDPNGAMVAIGEVPPGYEVDPETGDLVNPTDHTRIGEVSLAARDWKSGDGRVWKDAVRHIAFTPLPVNHGTPGFEVALGTVPEPDPSDLILGTATLHTRHDLNLSTHTRKGDDMPEPTKPDEEPVDIMGEGEEDEGGKDKPIIDFDNSPGTGNEADEVKELIDLAAESGMHVAPGDQTYKDFCHHLLIAMRAVKHREKPPEPEPEANAEKPPPQEPVQEEAPPLLMSTATAKSPREKALLSLIGKDVKTGVLAKIDTYAGIKDPASGIPWLKPDRVEALRSEASGFQLSLTWDADSGEYQPAETELDRTLALLEELAPIQLSLHDAEENIPPEKQDAAAVDEVVAKISSPGVQKKTA